jgi:tetratricopeptide (TPR) repeat protein
MEKVKTKNAKRVAAATVPDLTEKRRYLWVAGILAITFIMFIPAIRSEFITFDDLQYVVENPYIKGLTADNLKAIFFRDANDLGNYHPVTLVTYAVNYAFSELDPIPYHLVNVLLHLLNTFLVFQLSMLLFTRLGLDRRLLLSSIVALLFGIHPLHVESVAWVSGRKDLLYTCFYMLSLISYVRYLDKKSAGMYILALVFFLLSLMSKGMAVTLALSVVAIDYLLKRDLLSKKVILEKIPFFAMSLLFGIIAIMVQQAQGATEIIKFGVADRVVFASFGFTQYLIKLVFPYKLCGYYPYPDLKVATIPAAWYFSVVPVLAFVGTLGYFSLLRPNRKIVFGIVFFLLNVLLVLQLFPVGSAVMADRYTYLSSFGFFFLVALGSGFLMQNRAATRLMIPGLFLAYAALLSFVSNQRCAVWHDSYSFWNDIVEKYPHFYPAINNLGEFYEKDGRTEEAFQQFSNSIKAHEDNPNAYFHRGSIYGKSGQSREAIADFSQAIRFSPGFTQAYVNRAIARAMIEDYTGALADLDSVIRREKNEGAYFNRGILKNQMKVYAQAVADFQEAIKLNPSCARCYYSMGMANYHAKLYPAAAAAFSAYLSLDPQSGNAYYYRALCRIEGGRPDSICSDLDRAVKLGNKEAGPYLEQYCRQKN